MKNLGNEIWKDIPDYEGLYQVSNLGRVKSLNYNHTGKPKILKLHRQNGYLSVTLCKNNNPMYYYVHRLVAKMFIPNPNNYPIINHKDENKMNNFVNNLEWCTHKYNTNYGSCIKRFSEKQMKCVACYKDSILVNVYPSTQSTIIDGFNQGHVAAVCRGERNKHHGCSFKYITKKEYIKYKELLR